MGYYGRDETNDKGKLLLTAATESKSVYRTPCSASAQEVLARREGTPHQHVQTHRLHTEAGVPR